MTNKPKYQRLGIPSPPYTLPSVELSTDQSFYTTEECDKTVIVEASGFDSFPCDWKDDDACSGVSIQCSVCKYWTCVDCLIEKISKIFAFDNKIISGIENKDLYHYIVFQSEKKRENNDPFYCPLCIDYIIFHVIQPIAIVYKDFLNYQYGNQYKSENKREAKLPLIDIQGDSDYKWRTLNVYGIINVYKLCNYDNDTFDRVCNLREFMEEGKEDFLSLIHEMRNDFTNNIFEEIIPNSNAAVWADAVRMKQFIVYFIKANRVLLIDKCDEFLTLLWRELKKKINDSWLNLKIFYEHEQHLPRIEAIIESICKTFKLIYNPTMKIDTLIQTLKNKLYLTHNEEQRSMIVEALAYLHSKMYEYGANYRSRKNKQKHQKSAAMRKFEKASTDKATSLKCSKQAKLDRWFDSSAV